MVALHPVLPTKIAPGPSVGQLLVSLPRLWRNPAFWVMDMAQHYGDVVRLRLWPFFEVHLISHPDHITHVLQSHYQNYPKYVLFKLFETGMGQGLVTSSGERWQRQRRLMQPVFNHEALADISHEMTRLTGNLLTQWHTLYATGRPFNLTTEMMNLTRDIIIQTIFQADMAAEVDAARHAFFEAARSVLLFGNIPTPSQRRFHQALTALDKRIWHLIALRRRQPGPDLLSLLMSATDKKTGQGMADQQLRDELVTLLFTGHDTLAQAMTWLWTMLAEAPQVEARLHIELLTVLAGRTPAFTDIPRLPYTAMVCQEVLRIFPPAWAGGRHVQKADTIGGYHIPAGSVIVFSPYVTHHRPDIWPNPAEFNPDRFTPQAIANRPALAYLPFGGGARVCIGRSFALLEMQLMLAFIAQHYRLRRVSNQPIEIDSRVVVMKPRGKLMMRLEPVV